MAAAGRQGRYPLRRGNDGQIPAELKTQVPSFFLIALITASLEVALTVNNMPSFS